jgi:hypothetical protein
LCAISLALVIDRQPVLVSRCTVPVCLPRRHAVFCLGEHRRVPAAEPDIRRRAG